MTYRFQIKKQFGAALIALVVVIAIGYVVYGMIDWPTVIGVTLGVFFGMGVMRTEDAEALDREKKDQDRPNENGGRPSY